MPDVRILRENLIKQAKTVLQPGLAILIECAFEAEQNKEAAGFLEGLMERFFVCAEKGLPLRDGDFEAFVMFMPTPTGDADMIGVGLLSAETIAAESIEPSEIIPGADGFVNYVSGRAACLELSKFAPLILGVGIADTAAEAQLLARKAMFRSPDRHSTDASTAELERRIRAHLNRNGPGAGGFGGGHTALAVSIEQTGTGFTALCPGDYFTRFASKRLSIV